MADGAVARSDLAWAAAADWHVLQSKPRCEALAALHLRHQGFDVFLPRLRRSRPAAQGMRITVEPLFPRYLFLRAAADWPAWSAVRSTRGVQGLVRFGERLACMPPSVMHTLLQARQGEDDLIELPKAAVQPGRRVRVLDGPFADLQGICLETCGARRVRILIELMGAPRTIELSVGQVRALHA